MKARLKMTREKDKVCLLGRMGEDFRELLRKIRCTVKVDSSIPKAVTVEFIILKKEDY
jgi:hypothetical protein